jgi:hypothetical protein
MDENLPRWIWLSITSHFNNYKQDITYEVNGYDRLEQAKDSFQIRINGPIYNKLTVNSFEVDVDINILITTIKEDTDEVKLQRMQGIISQGFTDEIKILKYGNGKTLYGCLILQTPIIITNFGAVEETSNVLQSTIEGQYKWRN